ncbi:MAG: uroporphyrinogen-III synthase [Chloroflexi bacterium]|nr:uroporphyrinogen-III synthase [Ktedonobacteraceae bacterium]MBV9021830.1 uroporphyrinogen-III synthase [Ktedonobacteraceae bacterium]MBV9707379.1 uroporphyrinogen-III synthase [Chloroflexota bacterium]
MSEQRLATSALQGKRVLVTRTRNQASAFSQKLQALGAIAVEFPTISIVAPEDWSQLDSAMERLYISAPIGEGHAQGKHGQCPYQWLVLTSANGVTICFDRLQTLGYDPRAMQHVRIATIGPATAAALQHYGVSADLVPDDYIAEGVVRALVHDAHQHGTSLLDQHILLARAAEARKVLVTELQHAGARVDEVPLYHTVAAAHDDERGRHVLSLLQQQQLDILTFTSSSTVRNFVAWLKSCEQNEHTSAMSLIAQSTIACIGPITSQTAHALGLHVDIEAQEFTIDGLVKAILEHEEVE